MDSPECQGRPLEEGYRRPLQHATQWYELLRVRVDERADHAVNDKHKEVEAEVEAVPDAGARAELDPEVEGLNDGVETSADVRRECSSMLQAKCPACFMATEYGRPFEM